MPKSTRRGAAITTGTAPAGTAHPLPHIAPPGLWQLLLEARAPWELAAALATAPWLARQQGLASGDGHPVLVFPGLAASDLSTLTLRNFLRSRGYTPYDWALGFNFGPRSGVLEHCAARLQDIAQRHGEPVSLVGWSLGGLYARELAKQQPRHARCVVTLGTPFAGHPRATRAWRLYELLSGQTAQDEAQLAALRVAPACPTTSIYSKTDGIVAWRCSLNAPAPHTENIEVHASHVGLGLNPLALLAVADRLAQNPKAWQRFDSSGLPRWLLRAA
jgi:pimeloyl-ACP methyl ester carboxylesterase